MASDNREPKTNRGMKMNAFESIVESQLARLNWIATDSQPTLAVAHADGDLPYGWVRVSDDCATLAIGPAVEIATALSEIEYGADYDDLAGLPFGKEPPHSTRDWPESLCFVDRLEEGTTNDNPNTLITVATNAGIRYAAGPHGVFSCALADWLREGDLAPTRESAIEGGCEFADEENGA